MALNLSARITERTKLKSPARNAQNRAAFLALRPDIEEALKDGWPVKTIWETLHEEGKITYGYQAFRGYVNRLILSDTIPPSVKPNLIVNEKNQSTPFHDIPGFVTSPIQKKEDFI